MQESEKWKWCHSVVSNSSRPHGLQPTRLLRPWDFPGKSTGVGYIVVSHFNLHFLDDTYYVEHLFICFFAVYISSLVKCLLRSLVHFFKFIVFLFWALKILCIFLIAVLYQFFTCKYFLPVCGLSSHLLTLSFAEQIFLSLIKSSLSFIHV